MSDETILELYLKAHEAAIEATREKFGKRLFSTAYNILGDREDAEECVNDALFKAWEMIPRAKPTMLGAYLAKITRNLAINKYRAKSAAKRGGGEVDFLLSELEEVLSAGGSAPDEEYERRLVQKGIHTALGKMDKKIRVVFVMRYFHSESIASIGAHFKYSESKVKSMLFRARNKLRDHLESEGIKI